jgi:hypothetical protein
LQVTITLDGVYLVASPLDDETWDETARREWGWARKQARLNQLLAQRTVARTAQAVEEAGDEDGAPEDAVAQSTRLNLLSRIVNNVQVPFLTRLLRSSPFPFPPFSCTTWLSSIAGPLQICSHATTSRHLHLTPALLLLFTVERKP